ncbi:MAG: DNA translocase FtsK [Anaerolineae bacterium]|nr:DNA translocase FtsK [Anaerolineae bacterium]
MNRHIRLEHQADRIEATLATHKVNSRVAGGTVTSRFVRFDVLPEPGTRVRRIQSLAEELALSLNASSCRVFRRGGRVQVEVPREDPRRVEFLQLCRRLTEVPPVTALLGVDEEAVPVLLRLPSPDVAHVLISGNTGSGKTVLARTMALSLAMYNAPRQVQLVFIDPKQRGFAPLAQLPHLLTPPVSHDGRAAIVLSRLTEEMERRDQCGCDTPRIVVFIDELADLMMSGGRAIAAPLTRLAQRGREAGIHLVACTQRPTAAVIGGLVKSNFPVRVVGSVASAEDAKVAAGLPRTGAERLLGKGDFIVVARGEQVRVQGSYAGPQEIRRIVMQLCNGKHVSSPRLGKRVADATKRLVSNLSITAQAAR